MHKGSCLCGRVTLEVSGDLKAPDGCHCTQCRKQTGHFLVSTDIPRSSLRVNGSEFVKWFPSSEKVRRGFCGECGSTLFWDPLSGDWTSVAMGCFDDLTAVKMDKHIHVVSKGDYYDINDDLPQFLTVPPRPGG